MITERHDNNFFINQTFSTESVDPDILDWLLAQGWRHFGYHFFRFNFANYDDRLVRVIPLRINLETFTLTKKQRRILRQNADFSIELIPTTLFPELIELFFLHREKFTRDKPEHLSDFFSPYPYSQPCKNETLIVRDKSKIIAASFLDIGNSSTSSIYAIYNPDYSRYSPGIFTILKEIEYSQKLGKKYYYHGYIYNCNSFYDYKKRFNAIEYFDWDTEWLPLNETVK